MSVPIAVTRGNSVVVPFEFKDPDGQPFNLTGSVLIFYATTLGERMAKSSASVGSGFEITDATAGQARLMMTPAESRALRPLYDSKWEIERRSTIGETTIATGRFAVTESINEDA